MNFTDEWLFRLALRLIPGIGDKLYKQLMAKCGSARCVYEQRNDSMRGIPGIGIKAAESLKRAWPLKQAESELMFIDRNGIEAIFYLDQEYPERLKWCDDGPVILFSKGNFRSASQPMLGMVGTRSATHYGLEFCEKFIRDLVAYSPVIVSGLAYGIDIKCHREALDNGIPTLALLGHGLDRLYPAAHSRDARRIVENGALMTEFLSGVKPDRENFPRRNRIVAGMCDAILVVEAARKGGALITAEIANSYNREVFALPGRVGDSFSEGCNFLIKHNKASLITSVHDLEYILNWKKQEGKSGTQHTLPLDLTEEEIKLIRLIKSQDDSVEITRLCQISDRKVSDLLQCLMQLELKGLVISKPGNRYALSSHVG